MDIVIRGRIPSKKNSRQLFSRGGRVMSIPSKDYTAWHKTASEQLADVPKNLLEHVQEVVLDLWAPDKRLSDLTNKAESIMDLLVDNSILKDDNWFIVNRVVLNFRGVDKIDPRVEVHIHTYDK